jgi:hypothetical protein
VEKYLGKIMLTTSIDVPLVDLVICITKQDEHHNGWGWVVAQVEVCGVDGDWSRLPTGTRWQH